MILLTGASGFIGKNLALYLHKKGESILASGRRAEDEYFDDNGITYIKLDIADKKKYSNLDEYPIKKIVHLAAIVPTHKKVHTTEEYISINGNGILNLLDFCIAHKIEKFVNISSLSVYGASGINGVNENIGLSPFGSYADYAIAKIIAELHTGRYAIDHRLNSVTLRLGYIFGDNDKEHLLLPRLLKRAFDGEEIVIEGTGDYIFDVAYIDDCIAVIEAALKTSNQGIFNVGSGEPVRLNQIVESINNYVFSITKRRTVVRHVDSDDQKSGYVMSLDKTKKYLGFQPKFRGMEVIQQVLKDYHDNRFGDNK